MTPRALAVAPSIPSHPFRESDTEQPQGELIWQALSSIDTPMIYLDAICLVCGELYRVVQHFLRNDTIPLTTRLISNVSA